MNAKEALDLLAQATQPQMAGQINREGYCRIQQALETLAKLVEAPAPEAGQTPAEATESAV